MKRLTVPPLPNIPEPIFGDYWFGLPTTGGNSTLLLTQARHMLMPVVVGQRAKIAQISVQVTTAGAASATLRCGLYDFAADGTPGSLIADYSTQTATAGGMKFWTPGTLPTLEPETQYGISITAQGAPTTQSTLRSRLGADPLVPIELAATATTGAFALQSAWYANGVTGALPGAFGTPAGIMQGPGLLLKFSAP